MSTKFSASADKFALSKIEGMLTHLKIDISMLNSLEDERKSTNHEQLLASNRARIRALSYAKRAILELRRRREWGEQLNRKNTE